MMNKRQCFLQKERGRVKDKVLRGNINLKKTTEMGDASRLLLLRHQLD